MSGLSDKTVLVTGSAGSIGTALVKRLLDEAKVVRGLDNDEYGIFCLRDALSSHKNKEKFRMLLGDVRDKERLDRAVDGVDIVYHLAALKHVSIANWNPFEVVKTNIVGTQNVLESVLDANTVEMFVFFSSDKATNPKGIYGMSKLVGEQLTLSARAYRGDRPTKFCCVRLGNVIGSRGSVWDVWERQIREKKPLTVTDVDMTRYFMTMDEAVNFTIEASMAMADGQIAIPKMTEYNIADLARKQGAQGEMQITGIGVDEKLHEELFTFEEAQRAEEKPGYWVIKESR